MFRICTLDNASILHEVEPNNPDFRCNYIVPEFIFGLICISHIAIPEEWVTEAVTGEVDIMICNDDSKMECRTEF